MSTLDSDENERVRIDQTSTEAKTIHINELSEDMLIEHLSETPLNFEEASIYIKELFERFGIESFKFLRFLQLENFDFEKAVALVDPFIGVPIIKELSNGRGDDDGIDVDVDFYKKETENAKNEVQKLNFYLTEFINRLRSEGVYLPSESDINQSFLDKYFKKEDHESVKDILLYGIVGKYEGPISNAFYEAVSDGNLEHIKILYNSTPLFTRKEEFLNACINGDSKLLQFFLPHIKDLIFENKSYIYPTMILQNHKLRNDECKIIFEELCKIDCIVNPITFRAAVFENRPEAVEYMLANYSFGIKMLRRLARSTSSKKIEKIINKYL